MITIKTTKSVDKEFNISDNFPKNNFIIEYEKNVFGMSDLDVVITFILNSLLSGLIYDLLKNGVLSIRSKMKKSIRKVDVIINLENSYYFKLNDKQIVLFDNGTERQIKGLEEMFEILESKIKLS